MMAFPLGKHVSIRSPDRSQGRPDAIAGIYVADHVSIRSPDRSQGRHTRSAAQEWADVFQSAPLTEARGDLRASVGADRPGRGFNPLP